MRDEWNPEEGVYRGPTVVRSFLLLLALLQVLLLIWLRELLRAVYNALFVAGQIEDHRSDCDGSDSDSSGKQVKQS